MTKKETNRTIYLSGPHFAHFALGARKYIVHTVEADAIIEVPTAAMGNAIVRALRALVK